jgi:hypothetical protein
MNMNCFLLGYYGEKSVHWSHLSHQINFKIFGASVMVLQHYIVSFPSDHLVDLEWLIKLLMAER